MTHRMESLAQAALGLVAIWVAFAFFNTSEFYQWTQQTYGPSWREVLLLQMTTSLIWALFTPIIVAVAVWLPPRRPHRLRNVVALAAFVPVVATLRAIVGGAANQLAEGDAVTLAFLLLSVRVRFHRNVFLTLVIVGITYLFLAQREAEARRRKTYALATAVANLELARLRARMQPRFLFAALEAISARVRRDPQQADALLVDVSTLLRQTLELDRRGEVELGGELELVDLYLDIEKRRYGGRLTTRIVLDEQFLATLIPALLLRMLVESAVLTMRPEGKGRLEIGAREHGRGLRVELRCSGAIAGPDAQTVEEMRARLEQVFAGAAGVETAYEGDTIVTAVLLPMRVLSGVSVA